MAHRCPPTAGVFVGWRSPASMAGGAIASCPLLRGGCFKRRALCILLARGSVGALALTPPPAPRSRPKGSKAGGIAAGWGYAQHYFAWRADVRERISLVAPTLLGLQSVERPLVALPIAGPGFVAGRIARVGPLLHAGALGRCALIGRYALARPPLLLVVLRAWPLPSAFALSGCALRCALAPPAVRSSLQPRTLSAFSNPHASRPLRPRGCRHSSAPAIFAVSLSHCPPTSVLGLLAKPLSLSARRSRPPHDRLWHGPSLRPTTCGGTLTTLAGAARCAYPLRPKGHWCAPGRRAQKSIWSRYYLCHLRVQRSQTKPTQMRQNSKNQFIYLLNAS